MSCVVEEQWQRLPGVVVVATAAVEVGEVVLWVVVVAVVQNHLPVPIDDLLTTDVPNRLPIVSNVWVGLCAVFCRTFVC